MQQLSSLGVSPNYFVKRNVITVSAGQAGESMSVLFTGIMQEAYADYAASPDVVFNVTALTGLDQKVASGACDITSGPGRCGTADGGLRLADGAVVREQRRQRGHLAERVLHWQPDGPDAQGGGRRGHPCHCRQQHLGDLAAVRLSRAIRADRAADIERDRHGWIPGLQRRQRRDPG